MRSARRATSGRSRALQLAASFPNTLIWLWCAAGRGGLNNPLDKLDEEIAEGASSPVSGVVGVGRGRRCAGQRRASAGAGRAAGLSLCADRLVHRLRPADRPLPLCAEEHPERVGHDAGPGADGAGRAVGRVHPARRRCRRTRRRAHAAGDLPPARCAAGARPGLRRCAPKASNTGCCFSMRCHGHDRRLHDAGARCNPQRPWSSAVAPWVRASRCSRASPSPRWRSSRRRSSVSGSAASPTGEACGRCLPCRAAIVAAGAIAAIFLDRGRMVRTGPQGRAR